MGRFSNGDARGRGRRLHAAGGHATQLFASDHHGCGAPSQAQSGKRPMSRGMDGFTMVTEPELRAASPRVEQTGLPLLVHAELPGPVDTATCQLAQADWSKYETYLKSRPDEAELSAIRLMLSLCREYHFRLHVVHLSTSQALDILRAAKSEGLPASVETCPHYLHLFSEKIPDSQTLFKCAPPIRGRENREKLWQGLREGVIDLVATDHSPCPPEMKRLDEGDFRTAWGG